MGNCMIDVPECENASNQAEQETKRALSFRAVLEDNMRLQ